VRADDLVFQLEHFFGKSFPPAQAPVIVKKMSRFSPQQLDTIYDKAIETCSYLFKPGSNPVAELYNVARDLGYFGDRREDSEAKFEDHDWSVVTACKLCHGQGAIVVFFALADNGKRRRTMKVLPFKGLETLDFERDHSDLFRSIGRCSCERGDVPTLPRGWPKYGSEEAELPRYRVNDDQQRDFKTAAAHMVDEDEESDAVPF